MAKIRLLNGKPLMVGGKVALNDACCCAAAGCELPDEDCGHAICFEFNVDASEQSADSQTDLFNIYRVGASERLGFWIDWDAEVYSCYSYVTATQVDIPIADINAVPGAWHTVRVTIWKDGSGNAKCRFEIDDGDSGAFAMLAAGNGDCEDRVRFGNQFIGFSAHRSYRNIHIASFNPNEGQFDFPGDSFDSLVGGASIVSDTLRIDTASAVAYGQVDLDIQWDINCKCNCPRDITEVSSIDVTMTINAVFSDAICGTGTRTDTHTFNFTRIDKATAFTTSFQFKLYLEAGAPCLNLVFVFPGGPPAFNWGKVGSICADTDFLFPAFTEIWDADCCCGTLDLVGSPSSVEARFDGSPDAGCNLGPCGFFLSEHQGDVANDIPICAQDFSALLGTYTQTHTEDYSPGQNVQITITQELVIS